MNLASGPKIPSWLNVRKKVDITNLCTVLSRHCVQQEKLAFVHKRTHSTKTLWNHSSVFCSLKASPRYIGTLYTKDRIILLWQIFRCPRPWDRWCTSCRRSVCPSHTVNKDRPRGCSERLAWSLYRRSFFTKTMSSWHERHHWNHQPLHHWLSCLFTCTRGRPCGWRTVSCILWTSKGFWFRGVSESSSQFLLSSQLSPCCPAIPDQQTWNPLQLLDAARNCN